MPLASPTGAVYLAAMKRHIRIFLAGFMVVAPFALTIWVVLWAGGKLDGLIRDAFELVREGSGKQVPPGGGVLPILVLIYLIGLLTRWVVFTHAVSVLERLLGRVPMLKGIYESVRDVVKLFGGSSAQMGQPVRFRWPGTDVELLGIRTNLAPRGCPPAEPGAASKVAVYLPMSYQIGGFMVYVPAESLQPANMTVEEALRTAATAEARAAAPLAE